MLGFHCNIIDTRTLLYNETTFIDYNVLFITVDLIPELYAA